ncbi:uncharacterized oxidoreductase YjmC [Malaya genurostris]|uniref:uncharacterized oxidoreductase YjmC n=1 Tax=Malaya genurostris TaxID=325434 RepID=UPI0026F3947B|nr:uncharacterized oxidoreductase YjmC [Malaya genurostris]XP_058458432.1 uncharacterized oxidoreductase YjmC [Malaya genurostris]XP_058458433.1 uncharacterized oxidoreductase YjmC [Malaya genurostris]
MISTATQHVVFPAISAVSACARQSAPKPRTLLQRVLVQDHRRRCVATLGADDKLRHQTNANHGITRSVTSDRRWKQAAVAPGTGINRSVLLCRSTVSVVADIGRQTRTMATAPQPRLIALEEARRFMVDCFVKSNTPPSHAKQMADLLVEADYRGHFSHGMNRLEMYINDLHKNACNGAAVPTILNELPAAAWVDGNNGFGAVVGNFCMDLAIKKAKAVGVGWVCAKRSNHYGIAGWYTIRAMKEGCIGISMTNTSPLASPTRSKEAALGTNPLSVGAPAENGDGFVLDMATTAVAVGKIEMQRRKGEPIPVGWAQDPSGHPTTDANIAFDTGCLMPLGGTELTSGYKGYGLSAMVEVFCGIMAGSNYATKVRKWTHAGADSEADLGQCFVAVNPAAFAPGFETRMTDLNSILRNMPKTDESKPVLVAGDPERNHMKKVDQEGGLAYHENQIKTCNQLSERLGVSPIAFL